MRRRLEIKPPRCAMRLHRENRMNNLVNIFMFESNNFNHAWEQAIRNVILNPRQITFGDKRDKKKALDSIQTIVLGYNAIKQIRARKIHPKFPFKAIDKYCEEFTDKFLEEYRKRPADEQFSYLYYDRIVHQIPRAKKNLQEQISIDVRSNRNQMTTWKTCLDPLSNASPCMQRIWIRHEGDNEVSVHIHWRSRDLFGAWQANLIAIVNMLYREILIPNDCEISRLIDFNDSLHIYETDIEAAKGVLNK